MPAKYAVRWPEVGSNSYCNCFLPYAEMTWSLGKPLHNQVSDCLFRNPYRYHLRQVLAQETYVGATCFQRLRKLQGVGDCSEV
jgi:hypothetical protein